MRLHKKGGWSIKTAVGHPGGSAGKVAKVDIACHYFRRGVNRMYELGAEEIRRCTATCKDGRPCQAWACWGDPAQRCRQHGGRPRHKRPVCRCAAYQWPHRPGGGLCLWPNPPITVCPTPAGTHGEFRSLRQALRRG